MTFVENQEILREEQHGFRKAHSCESQLVGFIDEAAEAMKRGLQEDVLIMNFSKAFYKVSHALLVHKLHQYGIRGEINKWIQNFLTGRQQSVVVGGSRSDSVPVESGVPQGSVLAPSLFLLYINDLPKGLQSTARLFADDTACHKTITTKEDQQVIQRDLDKLSHWEETWKMQFHPRYTSSHTL